MSATKAALYPEKGLSNFSMFDIILIS